MLFGATADDDTLSETLKSCVLDIKVHRDHVMKELEDIFINEDLQCVRGMIVDVKMILPNGKEVAEDGGGVLQDMLTEYWQTFYTLRCNGRELKVPVVSPAIDSQRWTAVGSILLMRYYLESYLPVRLAPCF